jgi:aryl-alcohol dehydrogenase-like predicted oxidoreductase
MVAGTIDAQRNVVARALDLGINFFDLAAAYGRGESERNLGRVLHDLRAAPIVATKVLITMDDVSNVAAAMVRSIEASLRRLKMDRVDIIEIHNSPDRSRKEQHPGWTNLTVDDYLGENGVVDGLERLRSDGKGAVFGLTCAPADMESVREVITTAKFQLLNVHCNLLNPSAGEAVPTGLEITHDYEEIIQFASARGIAVAAVSPLGPRVLSDRAIAGAARSPVAGTILTVDSPRHERLLKQAKAFSFLSQPGQRSLAQSAVKFLLMNSSVTTVICGFSNLAQVDEMALVPNQRTLSSGDIEAIHRVWSSNFN